MLLAGCALLAFASLAHAAHYLSLSYEETGEWGDLELPVRTAKPVTVTAYEELADGKTRPLTVLVRGRGAWSGPSGLAGLRVAASESFAEGTPCQRFTPPCPSGQDADGYCNGNGLPRQTVQFCGRKEGETGADFMLYALCPPTEDDYANNTREVLTIQVVAALSPRASCPGELPPPLPPGVEPEEYHLPPRSERAWRHHVIEAQ